MRAGILTLAVLLFSFVAPAKEAPQVIDWPETGAPVLRFTITKIRHIGSFGGQQTYVFDTRVDNLWSKRIPSASFRFYMFDKSKVRIGEGYLDLTNLSPHETIRMEINAVTVGTPVTLTVVPQTLPAELSAHAPPKIVTLTVYSVPSGARLSVDGNEAGVTPLALKLPVGSHTLQFSKEGFNTGTYPLVITPDQVSGGQISYELGASAHDTIELRDGTLLNADVESVSATEVVISMGGKQQTFERNLVKRILFVQRGPAPPAR
jgi:PEGA domain